MEGAAPAAGASSAPAVQLHLLQLGYTYATGHASPAAAKILAEKGIDPSL